MWLPFILFYFIFFHQSPEVELVKEEEAEVKEVQAYVSLTQNPNKDLRLIGDDGKTQTQTRCVSLVEEIKFYTSNAN